MGRHHWCRSCFLPSRHHSSTNDDDLRREGSLQGNDGLRKANRRVSFDSFTSWNRVQKLTLFTLLSSSVPKELPLSSRELEPTSSEELLEPESCRCTTNSKNSCSERSTPEERKSNASTPKSQNLSLCSPPPTRCPRYLFYLPFLSIFFFIHDDHLFRYGNTSSREACIFRVPFVLGREMRECERLK